MVEILSFEDATKWLELDGAINWRNLNNPSGNLPYHNNQHMDFMLADVINASVYYRFIDNEVTQPPYGYALYFAAMFHDCDHSGGVLHDSINIDKAIKFWKTFVELEGNIVSFWIKAVTSFLIRATQYPYIAAFETDEFARIAEEDDHIDMDVMKILVGILRDADLMTIYHGTRGIEMVNVGLYEEFSAPGHMAEGMTYASFADKSYEFMKNVGWQTGWGSQRAITVDREMLIEKTQHDIALRLVHIDIHSQNKCVCTDEQGQPLNQCNECPR